MPYVGMVLWAVGSTSVVNEPDGFDSS